MNIHPNEIHLWFAYDEKISDSKLLTQYHRLLTEEESSRLIRFKFQRHRHQYLISRALIRTVLSLYMNDILPEKWQFEKNDFGKPFICNKSVKLPLKFNMSHTDKLAVLAVTLNLEIGVDAEYVLRPGKTVEIAASYFSPIEMQQLYALSEEKQNERFFNIWTLKEAYIKACGMGLSIPLDHFSFTFSRQGGISIAFEPERDDQAEYWKFWLISPNDSHKVSVAIKADKKDTPCSLIMQEIIPLSAIEKRNFPIIMKSFS